MKISFCSGTTLNLNQFLELMPFSPDPITYALYCSGKVVLDLIIYKINLKYLEQIPSSDLRPELKGNCSGKQIFFIFLLLMEYAALMLRGKILDFLHGSVSRYKTLRSSTNCGCGHLMTQFVGIAIGGNCNSATVHSVAFTWPSGVHC